MLCKYIQGTYGVLDNNEISLILEWDTKIGQECISRLAHDHGREKLSTEPSTTAWRDGCFNDGNLQVGTSFAEHVCSTETARSSTDNDDVGFGIGIEIVEVTTSHRTRDLGLSNWSECKALLPFLCQFLECLGLSRMDGEWLGIEGLQCNAIK